MLKVDSPELTVLLIEKQLLSKRQYRDEIDRNEYELQKEIIDNKLREINEKIINEQIILRDKKDEENRRNEKMVEEVKKKEKVSKIRGPKKDSYASAILETLQKKSIKNVDQAADAVVEKKPGRDKAKVRAQIVVMINEVKNGKKPAYTWDEENFQLNLKV